MDKRICRKCNLEKPLQEFTKAKTCDGGYSYVCRKCTNLYQKEYYKIPRNKTSRLKQCKKYRKTHRRKLSQYNKEYLSRPDIKLRVVEKNRKRNLKLKTEVISHYGERCACCGESNLAFLSIDHLNGGGVKHRKAIKILFYRWLKQNNYPDGYQILCFNCNMGRQINKGICPHKQKEKE